MHVKLITVLCLAFGFLALVQGKSINKDNGRDDFYLHFDIVDKKYWLHLEFLVEESKENLKEEQNNSMV